MTNNLIIITGPTAVGKTAVAIEAARFLNSEIISADSRQIYREMSIGTAVPSAGELNSVKHHFIHSHSITENYNASRYETDALKLLEKLFVKYKSVVMTGGSMLYIDAICKGLDIIPDADPGIRQNLKKQLRDEGIESLRFQLKNSDPEYYSQTDLKNPARIIHALEIFLTTGKPYSAYLTSPKKQRPFKIVKIGLDIDRNELHRRINSRTDSMIETGLVEEAGRLYPLKHLNALNTVGYRELFSYFNGEISKEKAMELIKRNTRRYARKQLSWFRNDSEYSWFNPADKDKIFEYIKIKTSET